MKHNIKFLQELLQKILKECVNKHYIHILHFQNMYLLIIIGI